MDRKLASIRIIEKLEPIEGADRIEVATVMGWKVVVKKGEFSVGSRCVFFEIDSLLPSDAPWAKFMEQRKFRVKTVRLRGQVSQGLALTLRDTIGSLHSGVQTNVDDYDWLNISDDVTDLLQVKKYEPPPASGGIIGGKSAGSLPPGVERSNEPRIQSALPLLEAIRGRPFYITVKCDGTSATYARMHAPYGRFKEGELVVCTHSRAIERPEGENAFWKAVDRYELDRLIPKGIAVRGEVVGPKIQSNRMVLEDHDMLVYDVFDMREGRYYGYEELYEFCIERGLRMVPFVMAVVPDGFLGGDPLQAIVSSGSEGGHSMLWHSAGFLNSVMHSPEPFGPTLEWFLERAKGFYPGTGNRREGIVVRLMHDDTTDLLAGEGHDFKRVRISFKVINNDYLLKDEE